MGATRAGAGSLAGPKAKTVVPTTTAFHVMFGESAASAPKAGGAAPKGFAAKAGASKKAAGKDAAPRRVRNKVILEAKEVDGKIVSVKQLHRR